MLCRLCFCCCCCGIVAQSVLLPVLQGDGYILETLRLQHNSVAKLQEDRFHQDTEIHYCWCVPLTVHAVTL